MSKATDKKAVEDVMGMFIPTTKEEAPIKEEPTPAPVKQTTTTKDLFKKETKSRRVQIVMKPSLYDEAVSKAVKDGYLSFNDYVNTLVSRDLNKH